jgi:hypothetical protein
MVRRTQAAATACCKCREIGIGLRAGAITSGGVQSFVVINSIDGIENSAPAGQTEFLPIRLPMPKQKGPVEAGDGDRDEFNREE